MTTQGADRDRDAGDTLVEILLALMIMGVVCASVLAGLATVVTGSMSTRAGGTEETLLRDFAEVLIAPPGGSGESGVGYQACTSSSVPAYSDPLTVPSGFKVAVTSIGIWDGSVATQPTEGDGGLGTYATSGSSPLSWSPVFSSPWTPTTCYDHGLQEITITASTTQGLSVTESLTVLKVEAP